MSWIATRDDALAAQGVNLASNVDAQASSLGLTTPEAADLEAKANAFVADLQAKTAAEQAYRKAVADAKASAADLRRTMGILNRKVQANPSVSDALKLQVGFPVYNPNAPATPKTPLNLTANIEGQSSVLLRWKRNGNPSTAIFRIEQQLLSGPWTQIGTTANLRFRFSTTSPGTPMQFRVIAQVRTLTSTPSATAGLWSSDESEGNFELAA